MASLIVGIMGKKRSGKDTFAERLVAEHGFTRIGLADALKDVLRDLDPIVDWYGDEVRMEPTHLTDVLGPDDDWETAKELPEVRRLLQALGVAVRDHVGEDVWVDAVLDKADAIDGPVVIPDTRFPNEVDLIRAEAGDLVRIVRPGLVSDDTHVSETALDDVVGDYYVRNDGDIEQLNERADGVARHVFSMYAN